MNIGEFDFNEKHEPTGFMLGYPHRLTFKLPISRRGGETSQNGKKFPAYEVFADVDGKPFKVGAAWDEMDKRGYSYYRVEFNALGMLHPEKLYATLVTSTKNCNFSLLWDSPAERAEYKAKQQQQPTAIPA